MKTAFTPQQQTQLNEMFTSEIDKKTYANILRKLLYVSVMQNLKSDDLMYRDDLHEGIYWVTCLTEILDPTGILE